MSPFFFSFLWYCSQAPFMQPLDTIKFSFPSSLRPQIKPFLLPINILNLAYFLLPNNSSNHLLIPITTSKPFLQQLFFFFFFFFLVSNKNSINHEERTNKASTRCSRWWTQEKATNNNKDRKSRLGDKTKGRKKLNDGRTSQRAPAPRPIKQSTLA